MDREILVDEKILKEVAEEIKDEIYIEESIRRNRLHLIYGILFIVLGGAGMAAYIWL